MNNSFDFKTLLDGLSGDFEMQEAATRTSKSFAQDLAAIESEAFIFSDSSDIDTLTHQNSVLLQKWRVHETKAPSIPSLCFQACRHFEIHAPAYVNAVMMAALLAEIPNNASYHNNMHFCKVLLQTLRLISTHNRIYAGTNRKLNERAMALLLIAACIHDFRHDGLGNTVGGVFEQGRLERRAFDLSKPYLMKVGLTDSADFDALERMLRATEVTPLGSPSSPMNQMKAAYRAHFMAKTTSEGEIVHGFTPEMADMALLLHEADIATSAGLDYDCTLYETQLFLKEIGGGSAKPEHILGFLDQVCQGSFLSAAGNRLYGENLMRIHAHAQAECMAKPD